MSLILNKTTFFFACILSLPVKPYMEFEGSYSEMNYIKPIEYIETKKPVRVPQKVVLGMIQVESNGNDSAYNIKEDAVGCLQIRPIMVREVNRILRKTHKDNRFKMKDRWDRDKSLQMFWVWRDYHHPNSTDEVISRNWNGGPNGYKKKSTEKYWKKVNSCLESR